MTLNHFVSIARAAGLALVSSAIAIAPAAAQLGAVEATLGTIEYNLGPYRAGFGGPHTEPTYGVLLSSQTAITNYLLPAGSYAFGAACDYECTAISLEIYNSDGELVASKHPDSTLPDDELLFFLDVEEAGAYEAIVTMDECLTEGCHYGINAYRGFDESD